MVGSIFRHGPVKKHPGPTQASIVESRAERGDVFNPGFRFLLEHGAELRNLLSLSTPCSKYPEPVDRNGGIPQKNDYISLFRN
jgi:hypothetical protein